MFGNRSVWWICPAWAPWQPVLGKTGTRPVLYFGTCTELLNFLLKSTDVLFSENDSLSHFRRWRPKLQDLPGPLGLHFYPGHVDFSEITVNRRSHRYATLWAKLQPVWRERSKRAGGRQEWLNNPVIACSAHCLLLLLPQLRRGAKEGSKLKVFHY